MYVAPRAPHRNRYNFAELKISFALKSYQSTISTTSRVIKRDHLAVELDMHLIDVEISLSSANNVN